MSTSVFISISFAFLAASQTTLTTSTTPSSTSPAPNGPSCPASNNTIYITPTHSSFVIECGMDHVGGDLGSQSAHTLTECIQACDSTPGCVDISLSGAACYLKKSVGVAKAQIGIHGAKKITDAAATGATATIATTNSASPSPTGLSCPASNNTLVTADSGAQFVIECGIDHAAGDMGSASVPPGSISQCLQICDSTPGCVDVSLSGSGCYLKSSVGVKSYNAQVYGARLVVPGPNAPTTTATSSKASSIVSATPTSSVLGCPQSNGTVFTADSGFGYMIECDVDHPGGNMGSVKVTSFEACIQACDAQIDCVDVSLSGTACYQKAVLKPAVAARGILGARLLTTAASVPDSTASATVSASSSPTIATHGGMYPDCPSANGTTYTSSSGQAYIVECSFDQPGGNLFSKSMTGPSYSWLAECIETCANTTACVDVSLSLSQCYFKKTISPAVSVDHVNGARLAAFTSTFSSVGNSPSATASPTPVVAAAAVVGTFNYYACFSDLLPNRTLQDARLYGSPSTRNMSLEICASFCTKHAYFGVEYAQECYCGNSIVPPGAEQDPALCNMVCAGNATENCGGSKALSLYENTNYTAPVAPSTISSAPTIVATGSPFSNSTSSSFLPSTGPANVSLSTIASWNTSSTASISGLLTTTTATNNSAMSSLSSISNIPSTSITSSAPSTSSISGDPFSTAEVASSTTSLPSSTADSQSSTTSDISSITTDDTSSTSDVATSTADAPPSISSVPAFIRRKKHGTRPLGIR